MAGAEGLEPSTKVLETHVLPLHHAPKHFLNYTQVVGVCQAQNYKKHPEHRMRQEKVKIWGNS